MSSTRNLVVTLSVIASVVGAAPATAQVQSRDTMPVAHPTTPSSDSASASAGPRLAPTGVRRQFEFAGTAALAAPRQSMGKPLAMMIVGGAAIVLGALIGDGVGTLLELGGTISLLIGLYEYVK